MTRPNPSLGLAATAGLVFGVASLAPSLAEAAISADDPFAGLASIGTSELGTLRGGMMIAGIPVDFAVTIRTAVGTAMNSAGLQTTLTVNDQGLMTSNSTVTGHPNAVTATPDSVAMDLAGGATHVLQQVNQGQVQTLISNTADNVVISHSTQVDVHMPGFLALQQNWVAGAHAGRMGAEAAMFSLR